LQNFEYTGGKYVTPPPPKAIKYKHILEACSTLNDGRRVSFHKSLKPSASFNERQNLD
jgi:hypothetical protein